MVRQAVALVLLAACGYPSPLTVVCAKHPGACEDGGTGGDGGSLGLGGIVTGLNGASGLVLQNNGGDDKAIVADGAFRFATGLAVGAMYDVTVAVQPTNPSELCTVANGSGTAAAEVTDVTVTCAPAAYTIGGTVYGLTGSLTLTNNGNDTIMPTANGPFQFPTAVQSGQPYNVTSSAPGVCPVFGGTGTVGNAPVTSVVVNCGTGSGPFAIGGTVTGLNGTVKLKNTINNDTVAVTANGTYAFSMLVPSGGSYNVTVMTQPVYPPAAQTCTVANGSSTANGNVQNINVTCVTKSFTVGGSASGVTGTVTLQNNGTDNTSLTSGVVSYTFAMTLLSGAPYSVTVLSQPATLACSIANRTGTVANANVTNANLACSYNDPGILCGAGNYCSAGTQECCDPSGSPTCVTSGGGCPKPVLYCDSAADCGTKLCCAQTSGAMNLDGSSCTTAIGCTSGVFMCDPNAATPCPSGGLCKPWNGLAGYYFCN